MGPQNTSTQSLSNIMEFLLLLGFFPFAIFGAVAVRTFGLWGIALGMFLVGIVFGHPFFHVSVITLDRLILGIIVGGVVFFRLYGRIAGERWDLNDLFVALWIGWVTFNTFTHNFKIDGYSPASQWLFFYAVPVLMYAVARYLRPNPQEIKLMMLAFAGLGIYLSLTAACECFGIHGIVFPRFIVNPAFQEFYGRGRGPLMNPSGNGILITLGFICSLLLAKDFQHWNRVLLIAVVAVYALGIYSTLTRCAWLGGMGCLALFAWIYLPARIKWTGAIVGLMVAASLAPVVLPHINRFKRDKNVSVEDMAESAKLRPMLAVIGWEIIKDYPLRGVGMGHYLEYSIDYAQNRNIDMPLDLADKYVQHNIILSILIDHGAIGLVLFLMMVGKWCHTAWEIWRYRLATREAKYLVIIAAGFSIGYLANGMFQDVIIIPVVGSLLFFLAGMLRGVKANLAGQHQMLVENVALSSGSTPKPQLAMQP
jgi:O-antigen ligase